MALAEDSFHADPEERPPPLARSIEPSRWFALAGATLLYTLMFVGLTVDYRFAPTPEPVPQEIPIEIVPEPEPPPPPPQARETPKPQPSAQPELEDPATDAPRAGTKDHDTEIVDKSEKAPPKPAPSPPPDQKPEKPDDNPKPAEVAAKEDTKAPDIDQPAPDAPPAPVADGDTPPPSQAKADPNPPAQAPPKYVMPPMAFASVPDIDFGAEEIRTIVSGGRSKATYLSTLYGLIVPHVHMPSGHPKSGGAMGVVAFVVDAKGRLTDRRVARSSGSPDLDAAVFEAIGKSSPFPPPPHGAPMALEFTYNNN
jgi:protein TonB